MNVGRTRKLLVTGSSGLVGSEVVEAFCKDGWLVGGVDNNMREEFFGPEGSTAWRADELTTKYENFESLGMDIRQEFTLKAAVAAFKPDAIVHCASQPSHDLAAINPTLTWDVNVTATARLLEAARKYVPEAPFVFMSSNKVYGDVNNCLTTELPTRYESGLRMDETLTTDSTCRSIYGVSKLAADVLVQEYGSYFGMPTVALRCGCITGPNHASVAMHGFLSYMVRCNLEGREYNVNNYGGKQVRDNIHSSDVVALVKRFVERPVRCGEVYNVGGGRGTDVSVIEAGALIESMTGKPMKFTWKEKPRRGDFKFWVTDSTKAQREYEGWSVTVNGRQMIAEIVESWERRLVTR